MLIIARYIIYYLLGFILLYIDGSGDPDGGMTIGQIWKVPVILWLSYKVMNKFRHRFINYRFGFSFSQLLNVDTFENTFGNLSNVLKSLSLPLFITYIEYFVTYRAALKFLLIFSQIIIVSFIPFWLGLLEERHTFVGAELIDAHALIGVFNNAHTAAIYLSTSTLFLIFYNKYVVSSKHERRYINLIVLLGCYFLLHTYVRTGYLMFVVGVFILFFVVRKSFFKKVALISVGVSIIIVLGFFLVKNNKTLEARLTEQTGYNEGEAINGSGRLNFWMTSLGMWANSENVIYYLFGHGRTALQQRQYKENGLTIGSHNGYLDALSQNGIVGLSFFLLYYMCLFRFNKKYKKTAYYRLFIAWLISDLSFQMVQGGVFIFYDLMSAVIIMLPMLKHKEGIILNRIHD